MNTVFDTADNRLKSVLASYATGDNDYWSFRGKAVREHAHAYFQYPAMMVPQMQSKLIGAVLQAAPNVKSIYDPFVGSGTVMTEAMAHGLYFMGQDINPLAVLICLAKVGPFHTEILSTKFEELMNRVWHDDSTTCEADFPNLHKWFREDVIEDLSKLHRSIRTENALWARRFFWVVLAGTIRLTGNSRISTVKLHARRQDEIWQRNVSAIRTFQEIAAKNLRNHDEQRKLLEAKGLLRRGWYTGDISVEIGDSARIKLAARPSQDLVVTSPPYGDNVTTVTYGQHAYLPLQWIDLADIDTQLDRSCLASTHEIDTRSLGGVRKGAAVDAPALALRSPTFANFLAELEKRPRNRALYVTAFCRDLNLCIDPILSQLKAGSYMIWTVGNRRVSGLQVPADEILAELLQLRGCTLVSRLRRAISGKRMAAKNAIAPTMGTETILIMRKGN